MRKGLVWIGSIFIVAVVAVAALYFRGDLFHRAAPPGLQSSWVPVPHPPGDRPKPEIALIREFGVWHLSCIRQAQQPPKVGPIENLGILPDRSAAPSPCHVFIMMRDAAAPRQTMVMAFRYMADSTSPQLAVIYTTLDTSHVIYDRTGKSLDLSQKLTLRGGFYHDPKRGPLQSQSAPEIGVQLGRTSFTIPTRACIRGHCFGRLKSANTGAIESVSSVVVRLSGRPHGQPRVVVVPADGLGPALAELKRMNAS